jgi:BirA family biotin operon repressor/biotin-[acetyl-CoA-carboxylase] ligase
VGINVNQERFVGELEHKATSLKLEARRSVDREQLFREALISMEENYKSVAATGFQSVVPHWLSRSTMINKPISVSQQGHIISGIVKGLSTDGGLILQSDSGERTVFAGDVTIVGS